MKTQILATTIACALALTATAAVAGTYVTGDLPSEFGAGFIPPNPAILKNVQKASKEGAKLAASVEKCYSKGASNYSKGKATGVQACLNDLDKGVLIKYAAKIQSINQKAPGLPPCHNYVGDGVLIASLVKGFNGQVYCQSPSGAFVDGSSSF
jgi:hypothetical protein